MLVAPDVDALCASKMLADLFKQDDIMHRVIPVSGMNELEQTRDELVSNTEVRLTCGLQRHQGLTAPFVATHTHSH